MTDFIPMKAHDPNLGTQRVHYCPDIELANKYVSPLYADNLRGLPPLLIQVGGVERLF